MVHKFKNKGDKSLDKPVFLSEECLIINVSPTCKNMPNWWWIFSVESFGIRVGKAAFKPNCRVDCKNHSSLPLALSPARWEAVRPARGHKSWDFPSYSGQHTGLPHRGNEGQSLIESQGSDKKIKGQVRSCDLIKLLCSHSQYLHLPLYFYFTLQTKCNKVLQCGAVITKMTVFPCYQHGNVFMLHAALARLLILLSCWCYFILISFLFSALLKHPPLSLSCKFATRLISWSQLQCWGQFIWLIWLIWFLLD